MNMLVTFVTASLGFTSSSTCTLHSEVGLGESSVFFYDKKSGNTIRYVSFMVTNSAT